MNLLSITGINTFISTVPLDGLDTRYSVSKDSSGLYHYHAPQTFPGYYMPGIIHEAVFTEDFSNLYSGGKISTSEAIVEGHASGNFKQAAVSVQKNTQWSFRATATSSAPSFFVIAKNWYPEWNVAVDGRRIEPIKTNLIHMGMVIPSGRHTITAEYIPYSFYLGILGAALALIGSVIFIRFKSWK
jgi:hypothetical protein